MVYAESIHGLGLGVIKAWDPFELTELVEAGRRTVETEGAQVLNWPSVFDMREVDLLRLNGEAFRSLFRQRQSIAPGAANNLVAFAVRDEAAYGMLRMYSAYGELSDVRSQNHVHICYRLEDAFNWIAGHLDPGAKPELASVMRRFETLKPTDLEEKQLISQ